MVFIAAYHVLYAYFFKDFLSKKIDWRMQKKLIQNQGTNLGFHSSLQPDPMFFLFQLQMSGCHGVTTTSDGPEGGQSCFKKIMP